MYEQVTCYVREEMNRADKLNGKKKNTVGFALTQLQRRLASSPEAIFQSLKRRRKRLEARLEETRLLAQGLAVKQDGVAETLGQYTVTKTFELPEDFDELDEELSAEEYELFAEQVVDQATAAQTVPELESEIASLKNIERQALAVVQSGNDKKWEELSCLLQDRPEMFTPAKTRRKLIVFTEHKDTLNYLAGRICGMLGKPDALRVIHGSVNRDQRRKIQEEFRNDPEVVVLVATDAAGEGVNLQNANLMVNYDLPWNPNQLEQRFGRIHRIGQSEICHLWNLVAKETREGAVFQKLFDKIGRKPGRCSPACRNAGRPSGSSPTTSTPSAKEKNGPRTPAPTTSWSVRGGASWTLPPKRDWAENSSASVFNFSEERCSQISISKISPCFPKRGLTFLPD